MTHFRFLVIFFLCGFSLLADNWIDLVPELTEKDLEYINSGKYTDRVNVDFKEGLELFPTGSSLSDNFISELIKYDPELCVEMLFIIDKPNVPENEMMLYILNNFRAFSDQAGLEYYSSNRKRMHPLIKKSYFVNDKKKKMDDPLVSTLPEYEEHRYFQNDTTFGSNYYKLITRTSGNSIWIQMENIDSLSVFGIFKAIEKGEERVNFLIQVADDKIILYALAQIKEEPKVKKVLKWNVNIPGSFKRRMSTIVEWFTKRIL